MSSILKSAGFFFLLVAMPLAASADGVAQLKSFLRDVRTVKAQFSQAVLDKNGKTLQSASGTMQFSRPGKFRWTYSKPYEQLIVGDGVKLWVYDMDLNQVTVKKLDAAIGSSPAALLAAATKSRKASRSLMAVSVMAWNGWMPCRNPKNPHLKQYKWASANTACKRWNCAIILARPQ